MLLNREDLKTFYYTIHLQGHSHNRLWILVPCHPKSQYWENTLPLGPAVLFHKGANYSALFLWGASAGADQLHSPAPASGPLHIPWLGTKCSLPTGGLLSRPQKVSLPTSPLAGKDDIITQNFQGLSPNLYCSHQKSSSKLLRRHTPWCQQPGWIREFWEVFVL